MPDLDINQLLGLSATEIFSALFIVMLIKAPGDIDSDAGIKRVVAAKDNINLPVHCVTQPPQKPNRRLRSAP